MQCDLFEVYITEATAQLANLQKACVRLVSLDAVLFGALAGTHRGASASAALRNNKSNAPASSAPSSSSSSSSSALSLNAGAGQQRAAPVANDSDDDEDAVDIPDNDAGGAAQIRMTSPSSARSGSANGSDSGRDFGGSRQKQQPQQSAAPDGWGTTDPFAASGADQERGSMGSGFALSSSSSSSRHAHQEAIDLCLVHFSVVHRELTRALAMMRDHLNAVIRVQGANGGASAAASRSRFGACGCGCDRHASGFRTFLVCFWLFPVFTWLALAYFPSYPPMRTAGNPAAWLSSLVSLCYRPGAGTATPARYHGLW